MQCREVNPSKFFFHLTCLYKILIDGSSENTLHFWNQVSPYKKLFLFGWMWFLHLISMQVHSALLFFLFKEELKRFLHHTSQLFCWNNDDVEIFRNTKSNKTHFALDLLLYWSGSHILGIFCHWTGNQAHIYIYISSPATCGCITTPKSRVVTCTGGWSTTNTLYKF